MNTDLKYISEHERAKIADADFAGPNHTFPCDTQAHVDAAARLYGHAADPQAVRARIIEIAKRHGFDLPESWEKPGEADADDMQPGKSLLDMIDFKMVPFELKSASDTGSEFSGYANCFNNIDAAQEIVAPGAFKDSLEEFMATGFIGGLNHNWDQPLGRPLSAKEDAKGLFVEGKISPTQHGKDCMVLMKDNVIKKMSIGYKVLGDAMLEDAEDVAAYWKEMGYTPNAKDVSASKNGARLLTKIKLMEFSPVTVPANTLADITRVKGYAADTIETERQFERFLRDAGFARDAAKTICVSGFKALRQRDVEEAQAPAEAQPPAPEPEPTPEPECKTEETPPAKTEPQPIETAAPVVMDLSAAIHQAQVQALYADFQRTQARLGLR